MNASKICVAWIALLLAVGCRVEERMVWSPDGSRAAVLTSQGLCLMDPQGNLSEPIAREVAAVAWLPKARGLALVKTATVTRWSELQQTLPAEQVATLESLAKGAIQFFSGIAKVTGGDTETIEEKIFKPLQLRPPEWLPALSLCVRESYKNELEQAVRTGAIPSDWAMSIEQASEVRIHELCILKLEDASPVGEPLVLERSLQPLTEPRVSADGTQVAFLRGGSLVVAPTDGGAARWQAAEKVVGSFDWTPDGKALVYAARVNEKWEDNAINLVRIERRAMEGNASPLALAMLSFPPRVRCLPDGRVLFASLAMPLPAPANTKQEARFSMIDSSGALVSVPSRAGALPVDLGSFAVSPDGRQAAIVESGSDVVAVLDLTSGALEVVAPKRGAQCRALPAWRNAHELYFAALPTEGGMRPEWWRWTKGGSTQPISRSWPEEFVKNLLERAR